MIEATGRDSKIHNSVLAHNVLIPQSICIMNKQSMYLIHVNGTTRLGNRESLTHSTHVLLSNRKRRENYVQFILQV